VSTGKDVTETTPRILCNLGTNTVACRINSAGWGNKKGIAELKILDVVIGMKVILLTFKYIKE